MTDVHEQPPRVAGWRTALHAVIAAHRRAALESGIAWGAYDCAILAADAELAQTGHDPAAAYRGRYATRAEGLRMVRADGFDDYVDVFARRLPEIPVGHARTGDIAVIPGAAVRGEDPDDQESPGGERATGAGAALGIVEGPHIHTYAMAPGGRVEDAGFGVADLLTATRVFRVGR